MKTIKETRFMVYRFDETNLIFNNVWLETSTSMTEEELKSETLTATDLVEKYKPKFVLADDRNRQSIYDIDLQNWIAQTWASACVKSGVIKFALLLPTDIIAELSTSQTVEEVGAIPVEIKYFDELEQATEWFGLK